MHKWVVMYCIVVGGVCMVLYCMIMSYLYYVVLSYVVCHTVSLYCMG